MNAEYSAISAKLKAMHSKFLKADDYEKLLSCSSVSEIVAYLKASSGYSSVLSETNERDVHRGQIESTISTEIVDEYLRIYQFLDSSKREVLKFWFMRMEIKFLTNELKYIFTSENREKNSDDQHMFDAFFKTHTAINRELMQNAKTLSDCINACKDTPYAEPLKHAEASNADFFSVSMYLETFYYTSIWHTINTKLDKVQSDLFKKALGTKIDLLNILWIYRGKKYFNFEDEIIFTYLIPIRYRLSENMIKQMVTSEKPEDIINIVSETKYASLFDGIENGIFPAENYNKFIRKICKTMFTNHTQSLIAVYAYLELRNFELSNIKTLIEGVRYGKSTDIIRSHIYIE